MDWLGIWRHDLSPFLIEFSPGMGIRWYGMAYLLGFALGWVLLLVQSRRDWLDLPPVKCLDLILFGALAGVAGGRVGYVFFYDISSFLADPLYLIRIWEGGMSMFGGLLGAIGGTLWFAYQEDISFWELTDAGALATPPGMFLGRIANFINGELWGRPTTGDWGVIFPRAEPPVPRHPSQLYQAAAEGIVLFLIVYVTRTKTRAKGVASVVFLGSYGVLRFLVEFYRAPDPHLGFDWLGMTRGQWFGIGAIAVALVLYVGVVLGTEQKE